jgi:hypothetical protein
LVRLARESLFWLFLWYFAILYFFRDKRYGVKGGAILLLEEMYYLLLTIILGFISVVQMIGTLFAYPSILHKGPIVKNIHVIMYTLYDSFVFELCCYQTLY